MIILFVFEVFFLKNSISILILCKQNYLNEEVGLQEICLRNPTTVCAFQQEKGSKMGKIYQQFSNLCLACADNQTAFVVSGSCDRFPEGTQICDPIENEN